MKPRVLIVDDDQAMAGLVAASLESAGYECQSSTDARVVPALLEDWSADIVVTDLKMPEMDGLDLLRQLRAAKPALPVIMLTGYGSVASAVTAMREGAFDYVLKPFHDEDLRSSVARALEVSRLDRENRYLRQQVAGRYALDQIVAASPRSQELMSLVRCVAPSRATVLIQGESGTGKEMVARLLHYWSDRVGNPFIAVNCKAFAEGVLESELFGHERGAFTGAIGQHPGCFERADGGTLLLDEIGEIGQDFQAKLLRVLQDGEVLRVGGTRARKVEVRVVAATNSLLRELVAAGRFREDLFFRVNVIPILLAPLRERREDILPLARQFLARNGRSLRLGRDAEQALMDYHWPGNIRELENVVERATVLAAGPLITRADLLLEQCSAADQRATEGSLEQVLDQAMASRITAALRACNGNRSKAAQALNVDRSTLYRLMKKLGLGQRGEKPMPTARDS